MKQSGRKNYKSTIRKLLKMNNQLILASDLANRNIPGYYLPRMVKSGELIKLKRGIYASPELLEDDLFILQSIYKRAIFSHGTALYYLGLVDRNPMVLTITVPQSYNATSIKKQGHRVFFIKSALHDLGVTETRTEMGNRILLYNRERSLCDVVRNRSRIDIQIINVAYKAYFQSSNINILLLNQYAEALNVSKLVTEKIRILL